MKTKISKIALPTTVIAIAVASAFSTHAMTGHAKNAALEQGYQKLNPQGTICQQEDMCSDVESDFVCTVGQIPGNPQLYGKNSAGECTITLYRPNP